MDIFSILTLLGGVGLFLYGMNLMGASLKNLAGGSLQKVLEKLTTGKNKATGAIKGFGLGTGVTAIIQSSAATTIMLIGFVNAGIMKLSQAIPVVFGANIGSTATAQILRLGDLGEHNVFIKLFKPSSFAPMLICIGAFIILFSKKKRNKDIAGILVGLGVLFFGMTTMEGVFAPLKESEKFQELFTSFNNPLLGILIGLVLTAIIQSSSASVGILQAISSTGVVTYGTAIPIIIGQNIGKCMTIILGSIGANKKAKRVSLSYLLFNIFGAVFFTIVIYGLQLFIKMPFMDNVINRGGIANVHFLFNFLTSLMLLPLTSKMADITGKLIGDDEESKIDKELRSLDPMLLTTPNVAITQCKNVMHSMMDAVSENFHIGCDLIKKYDQKQADILLENEEFIDRCESALNEYLLKVTSKNLTKHDRRQASELLNSVSDLERIGDYCENLMVTAKSIEEQKITFSEDGSEELFTILAATENIITTTFNAFKDDDLTAIARIEPLAQTISEVKEIIKEHHVIRLQTGECGIAGGFALVDILTGLDRIGSHCSNIGLHIAKKISSENIDEMHGHIYTVGYKTSEEYKALYCYYVSLYSSPITSRYENKFSNDTIERKAVAEDIPDHKSSSDSKESSEHKDSSDRKKTSDRKDTPVRKLASEVKNKKKSDKQKSKNKKK